MFGIPDPLSDILANKMEKEIVKVVMSTAYSASISGMWSTGGGKLAQWLGVGQGERDAATATYLSLQPMVERGDLVLTVPKEMLEPNNLARFQTEEKK
jgi:hypothetical protein